jgi:hypothetical protein
MLSQQVFIWLAFESGPLVQFAKMLPPILNAVKGFFEGSKKLDVGLGFLEGHHLHCGVHFEIGPDFLQLLAADMPIDG